MENSITTTRSAPRTLTGNPFSDAITPATIERKNAVKKLSSQVSRLSFLVGLLCAALIAGASYSLALQPESNTPKSALQSAADAVSSVLNSVRNTVARVLGLRPPAGDQNTATSATAQLPTGAASGPGEIGNPFDENQFTKDAISDAGEGISRDLLGKRAQGKPTSQWIIEDNPKQAPDPTRLTWSMTPLRPRNALAQ